MTNRTAQRKRQPAKGRPSRSIQKKKQQQRRTRFGMLAIGAVVAIVAVMVVLSVSGGGGGGTTSPPGDAQAAEVIGALTSVPADALDAVGAGEGIAQPSAITANAPALTIDGKPEVLYIGAEYCPYCAAQRWPMVIALSRFGTFSGLGLSTSSASDIFPNTPTITFHGSSFSSDTLSFVAVETNTNQPAASGGYEPLETLTADQQQLLQAFDVPPYTTQAGSIPFVLIGNRFVISGASFAPDVLQDRTWQQIASALSDPSSEIAAQVLAAANMMTAAICELTDGQPANVCTAPGVAAAAAALPSA